MAGEVESAPLLHVLSLRGAAYYAQVEQTRSLFEGLDTGIACIASSDEASSDEADRLLRWLQCLVRAAATGGRVLQLLDTAAGLSNMQRVEAAMAADNGVAVVELRVGDGERPLAEQMEASGLLRRVSRESADSSTASAQTSGAVGSKRGEEDEDEQEEPEWLVQAASALLRSLPKNKGSSGSGAEDEAATLLRAALAQNASMQAVLQTQVEAEARALQEIVSLRKRLEAEQMRAAWLEEYVARTSPQKR